AGLNVIHEADLVHGHIHGGNILVENEADSIDTRIADICLHGPIDRPSRQSYGVIPFVVPEIFLMEIRHRTAYQLYESFGNIVATICDDQNTDKFDATEEAKFSKSVSDAEGWTRIGPTKVALKRFNNSQITSEDYVKQLYQLHFLRRECIAEYFGITKDHSSNYFFVMKYYENGNLLSYLDEAQGMLCWRDIIEMLWGISGGIECLHNIEFIHGNLHGGNVLIENEPNLVDTRIDVGLHSVFRENLNESYGVLPYVAPELLQGISPTKASDIYSFGIIMWTLSAGIRPWCNRPHDLELATLICLGNRPEIFEGTPNVYSQLMKQCWHPDPLKRPTASHLYELLGNWVSAICDDPESSDLSDQFDIAEEKKFSEFENNQFHQQEIHTKAFYTSRLLHFPKLFNSNYK
ncbi:16862_t:CDS:2, partial [Funneliformis geosporum]